MESTGGTPSPAEAREALAGVESAQRAVRDTPWPTWIYPVNALLLGAMALTSLLTEDRRTVFLAVAFTIVGVNMAAGYRMGAPWTVPTSRGFLAAVAAAGACVLAAFLVAELTELAWPVVALAVAATTAYLVAGVVHRRSTGRPQ
ncbi:hypothetical protein MO973_39025 [Paenibacillus sp. TRM 82003]|uniref:hypothetical protein n=1 Tax=Kineococcus sp. TRM81007 TaxID=2925831 RepID=UPI001F5626AD|nr:hypothetical protein [Kineococcus sp. TRM81007]MCI2239525.1 hypothetical protein [Kineococcus sp. TRM81007]MCI3926194.1 hypothetical protein [Paenibacillus sp. TRM 82003]